MTPLRGGPGPSRCPCQGPTAARAPLPPANRRIPAALPAAKRHLTNIQCKVGFEHLLLVSHTTAAVTCASAPGRRCSARPTRAARPALRSGTDEATRASVTPSQVFLGQLPHGSQPGMPSEAMAAAATRSIKKRKARRSTAPPGPRAHRPPRTCRGPLPDGCQLSARPRDPGPRRRQFAPQPPPCLLQLAPQPPRHRLASPSRRP